MRPKAKVEEEEIDTRPPSRSQKKRDSSALQVLGGKLAELPESALKRLSLPPRLHQAIKDYKALTKHEAKRRQLQFIGALMRETDADPLARAVDDMEAGNRGQAREFHELEAWRAALLAGDESHLEDILLLAPEEDRNTLRPQIRQLARNARAEQEKGKPPRSARSLFRLLRELKMGLAVSPTQDDAQAQGDEGQTGDAQAEADDADAPAPTGRRSVRF